MARESGYQTLAQYSACDISDALLALEPSQSGLRRTAGFLSGLTSRKDASQDNGSMIVGPAYTVQFQPKDTSLSPFAEPQEESNVRPGAQWSDLAQQGSIVVMQQPEGQKSAVAGGMHMMRLCMRGVKGLVVRGNIRDQRELASMELPTFTQGTSTVATGAESKLWATQVPITVSNLTIQPDDVICIDQIEGVVRIPQDLVSNVISWLEKRGSSDDDILADVKAGSSIEAAFAKHRDEAKALN